MSFVNVASSIASPETIEVVEAGEETSGGADLRPLVQKWRTGCDGRISLLKRRHGLNRSRYKVGMKRWVGLGVIADNLINIAHAMAASAARPA